MHPRILNDTEYLELERQCFGEEVCNSADIAEGSRMMENSETGLVSDYEGPSGMRATIAAANVIHELAVRIGPEVSEDVIPDVIRRQKWSALNLPLLWAAAGNMRTTSVLEWLVSAAELAPVSVSSGLAASEAIRRGWLRMRAGLRELQIRSQDDLVIWLQRHDFRCLYVGYHFNARAQQFILDELVRFDAQVALLQETFVTLTIALARVSDDAASRSSGPAAVPASAPRVRRRIPGERRSVRIREQCGSVSYPWHLLDEVDLIPIFKRRVCTLQHVPTEFRGPFRAVLVFCLDEILRGNQEGDLSEIRAWKLWLLLPRLLLRHHKTGGDKGKSQRVILHERLRRFWSGEWQLLLQDGLQENRDSGIRPRLQVDKQIKVEQLIRQGLLSRARACATSPGLAEGSQETLAILSDPMRRPPEPQKAIPSFAPTSYVSLDRKRLRLNLRGIRRGTAPGRSGWRGEHFRLLLEATDAHAFDAFAEVAELVANARIPEEARSAIALGGLTALNKVDEAGKIIGVRGICTGDQLRRLVARTLAQTHNDEFVMATAPYQVALGQRAGIDAAILTARVALESDSDLVLVALDGIGAYDHILRESMLARLDTLPGAREILPFVCMFYGQPSEYIYTTDDGVSHVVRQGEGGEQGDALMPALFSLGLDRPLKQGGEILQDGELAFAYLDDVYLLVKRDRARYVYDYFSRLIQESAGVRSNLGKTRCWGSGSIIPPPGIETLGDEVWRGDKDASAAGLKMLGSPIGCNLYIESWCASRAEYLEWTLKQFAQIHDPQCRWLLLKYCAEPMSNHALRNIPPSQVSTLAARHDDLLWSSLLALFDDIPAHELEVSRRIACLPLRHAGGGLRSALRTRHGAFWAAWADSLQFIITRFPMLGENILNQLDGRVACSSFTIRAVIEARSFLDEAGFSSPHWVALAAGHRPPEAAEDMERDPGQWQHGWQFFACDMLERREVEELREVMPDWMVALHRSQGGVGASAWLTCIPLCEALTLEPMLFLTALRRRLFLPLPVGSRFCRACNCSVDAWGHHALVCRRLGWMARRAGILETAWLQVFREAGAHVRHRPLLSSLAVPEVLEDDTRQLDIVAGGLPVFGGRTIVADATLRSPLTGTGSIRGRALCEDGSTFLQARIDKVDKYPELVNSARRHCFLVLASEVGGRHSEDCVRVIRILSSYLAGLQPRALRQSYRTIYFQRWWGIISVAVQRAVAANLLGADWELHHGIPLPSLEDLLGGVVQVPDARDSRVC